MQPQKKINQEALNQRFINAVKQGNYKLVKETLEQGANVNYNNSTALAKAIIVAGNTKNKDQGDELDIIGLLIDKGVEIGPVIDKKNKLQRPSIGNLVFQKCIPDYRILEYLLKKIPNELIKTSDKIYYLHQDYDVIKLLLWYGFPNYYETEFIIKNLEDKIKQLESNEMHPNTFTILLEDRKKLKIFKKFGLKEAFDIGYKKIVKKVNGTITENLNNLNLPAVLQKMIVDYLYPEDMNDFFEKLEKIDQEPKDLINTYHSIIEKRI